ncbi:hypothetical protein [Paraburkholderia sp. A3RO-2L]|uniref:hypothetical protein n=1 Tax=Paraburkholderia sp. A3RO-2L TaxID=3028376 RepID=UPI003DA9001D
MTTLLVIALAATLCLTLLAWFIRHNPLLWIATAVAWGMLLRTAFGSVRAYFAV